MTLLAVERIKLFSTRPPVWCIAAALALTLGATAGLVWLNARHSDGVSPESSRPSHPGLIVTMVMATLSVTTEYRFGTIKATFQAVPSRTRALLAKATVLALVAGFVGEISSFGSWGVARLITGSPHTDIATADEWREIAGMGLVYAVAAVLAVAVGALLRQSAAAVAILLLFPLLVEQLVEIVPEVGERLHDWMPFVAASQFAGTVDPTLPYGPWGGLAYFAAVAAALLVAALVVVEKETPEPRHDGARVSSHGYRGWGTSGNRGPLGRWSGPPIGGRPGSSIPGIAGRRLILGAPGFPGIMRT